MQKVGNFDGDDGGQYKNNRPENSLRPFRRRDPAVTLFRRPSTLQKSVLIQALIYHHGRHPESRTCFKSLRDTSLIEWRELILSSSWTLDEKLSRSAQAENAVQTDPIVSCHSKV